MKTINHPAVKTGFFSLYLQFSILLFFSICFYSCQNSESDPIEDDNPPSSNSEMTLREGQKLIYEIWQIENQLVPLKAEKDKALPESKKNQLIEKLRSTSLLGMSPSRRNHFALYRSKVEACAGKTDFDRGFCIGEMMFFLGPVLSDWMMDESTADSFENEKFTERVKNQIELMKSLTLAKKSGRPLPQPTAQVFAEMLILVNTIFAAPKMEKSDKKVNFARVALLGVAPSIIQEEEFRKIMIAGRLKLLQWSRKYQEENWEVIRNEGVMHTMTIYAQSGLGPSDFRGTCYEEILPVIESLNTLFGGRISKSKQGGG